MAEDAEPQDSGRVLLGVEIGELAAWVAVTRGKDAPERTWRARFTAPPDLDTMLSRITEGARVIGGDASVSGVGVASWMSDDSEGGAPAGAVAMEWSNAHLVAKLGERLSAPARLRAAVDAAALAEAALGAGTGVSQLVYIHLGREVLSSLVFNGEPPLRAPGRPGLFGHWRIAESGPRCSCGAVGHLNPLCASQSFVRLAIGLAAQHDDALAAVREATGGRVESLTAARVVALAGAGIEPLRELVERSADALGMALAQLSLVVPPERIVLGGPLGVAGGLFMDLARKRMTDDLSAIPTAGDKPQLVAAALEPHSALTGAWLLGRRSA